MIIEVTPTTGHVPNQQALGLLQLRAVERCNKPGGISVVVDEVAPVDSTAAHAWTLADLEAFERAHRTVQATKDTAVLYVAYLDGSYFANGTTVALAYNDHAVALFLDMLGPQGPEGAALVHELGHQLGLVDNGVKMLSPHEDPEHTKHDASTSCVMYYALEIGGNEKSPTDYCPPCKADLAAAGGR
jgi:hypothetical protein